MELKEKRADEILQQYVVLQRQKGVAVKLMEPGGKRIFGYSASFIARYSVAVAASIVLGLFILLDQPQKVYGYINEVPVTDKVQAMELSREMFDDLALGLAPAEDALENLLKL